MAEQSGSVRSGASPNGRAAASCPARTCNSASARDRRKGERHVARVNPGEFLRQVRAESAKIVWPSRKETLMTAVMVVIMTTLLAIFFFGVDSAFSAIVQFLLGLLG